MMDLLEISQQLPVREAAAGEYVLREGERTGALWILTRGRVEILKGDTPINQTAEPGAVFGEISLLLAQPHTASVRVLEPSTFRLAEDGQRFLAAHPAACFATARLLAQRLDGLTRYLVDLKAQFEDQKDHLGMVDEVLESLLHHQRRAR